MENDDNSMMDDAHHDSSETDSKPPQPHMFERPKFDRAQSLSAGTDHNLNLADFMPEHWDRRQADVRSRLERLQREVEAARTKQCASFHQQSCKRAAARALCFCCQFVVRHARCIAYQRFGLVTNAVCTSYAAQQQYVFT